MLVVRQTFNVKLGHKHEVVAALKESTEQFSSYKHAFRIYTPKTGCLDVVAVEWEYESLEEYNKLWAEWRTLPEAAAFLKQMYGLGKVGNTREFWWCEE
jgi:hypothetical protein